MWLVQGELKQMDSVVYTNDNHIVAEYQPGDTQVLNEFSAN